MSEISVKTLSREKISLLLNSTPFNGLAMTWFNNCSAAVSLQWSLLCVLVTSLEFVSTPCFQHHTYKMRPCETETYETHMRISRCPFSPPVKQVYNLDSALGMRKKPNLSRVSQESPVWYTVMSHCNNHWKEHIGSLFAFCFGPRPKKKNPNWSLPCLDCWF